MLAQKKQGEESQRQRSKERPLRIAKGGQGQPQDYGKGAFDCSGQIPYYQRYTMNTQLYYQNSAVSGMLSGQEHYYKVMEEQRRLGLSKDLRRAKKFKPTPTKSRDESPILRVISRNKLVIPVRPKVVPMV